jgi:hypothetical protein
VEEEKPEAEGEKKPEPAPEPVYKTLDEYNAERVKTVPKVMKARKIDESGLKGFKKIEKEEEQFLVRPKPEAEKETKKPAAKEQKPAEKKPEKKVLKTFFRMPRPNRPERPDRPERTDRRQRGGEREETKPQEPQIKPEDFPELTATA